MTKQLDDMWSSKWVLPEHREALMEDGRSLKRITKPDLDEQEIAIINQAIYGSLRQNRVVTLTLFDVYELETIVGTVIKVVAGIKQVKVLLWNPYAVEDECVWLFMGNILKAELREVEDWDNGEIDW
jgi:hypothetical protein